MSTEQTVKLVKIRFIEWRDQPAEPRLRMFQQQLDEWSTGISVLSTALGRMKEDHTDSETLEKSIEKATDDLAKIDAERDMLLKVEASAVGKEQAAARRHNRVGTFGYVVTDATGVEKIVDATGADLPRGAVYSKVVVDENPPLPAWAKAGKIGR